jgi:hypothetical protein
VQKFLTSNSTYLVLLNFCKNLLVTLSMPRKIFHDEMG